MPTGPLVGGTNADPLLGCKPEEEMGELEYGVFGLETDPLFLDRADALKWPHFGHVYSKHTHTYQYEPRAMEGGMVHTRIFPHTLFYKPIMVEALLAYERVS